VIVCRAGAIVLLVGFSFDGGLFKLATASVFWTLLELGQSRVSRVGAGALMQRNQSGDLAVASKKLFPGRYYIGIHLMEPSALSSAEGFIGWRMQLSPGVIDSRWKACMGFLILGNFVLFVVAWRYSKHLRKEAWFNEWKEGRSRLKVKHATLGVRQSTVGFQKNMCSYCGQKIAFPLNRVGECIHCPNCAVEIILCEPPEPMK